MIPYRSTRNIDMLDNLAPNPGSELDRLDLAADQAIAACGGDMRSAIRALILANEYLEFEISELFVAVSKGYARGRLKAKGGTAKD